MCVFQQSIILIRKTNHIQSLPSYKVLFSSRSQPYEKRGSMQRGMRGHTKCPGTLTIRPILWPWYRDAIKSGRFGAHLKHAHTQTDLQCYKHLTLHTCTQTSACEIGKIWIRPKDYSFFSFGHTACSRQDLCSLARDWPPHTLHWKLRVLTTGPPVKPFKGYSNISFLVGILCCGPGKTWPLGENGGSTQDLSLLCLVTSYGASQVAQW